MNGIYILHSEEKGLMDVLRAIKCAFASEELFGSLLLYSGDIEKMEAATGLQNTRNRILGDLLWEWSEFCTLGAYPDDPQRIFFILSTSKTYINSFDEKKNPALADVLVEGVDHDFWTILMPSDSRLDQVSKQFLDPQPAEPSHMREILSLLS